MFHSSCHNYQIEYNYDIQELYPFPAFPHEQYTRHRSHNHDQIVYL